MPDAREGEVKRLRARLAKQEKENERLRRVIKLMAGSEGSDEEEDEMAVDDPDSDVADEESSETATDDEETPIAIWDNTDSVYRCVDCGGEIDDGVCFECLREHVIDHENPEYNSLPASTSQAFCVDRLLAPRSTTPLLDLREADIAIPLLYKEPGNAHRPALNRSAEYVELRQRGATRAMCEEFFLEFKQEHGIVAWANQDIMDEFGGPAMQEGDKWKIYLGRRVQLDEDDTDGTFFIESILEDGILFAPKHEAQGWVTVKEKAGVWATKPNQALEEELEEAAGEEEEGDEDGDEDDDEDDDEEGEEDAVFLEPLVQNVYDLDDDEEERDATPEDDDREPSVKREEKASDAEVDGEEEGGEEGDLVHPSNANLTEFLAFSIADMDESDMEWEKQSTDASSCDSDFYDELS